MKIRITIFLTLVLLFLPHKSSACSCMQLTPCEAFASASAVFVGRMIEGTEKVSESTKDGKTISYEAGSVRFAVEESFKGVNTPEITIYVMNMKGTSCAGTSVGRGERYLVYAYSSNSRGLMVGACSATKLVERASEDLEFLRNLPAPGVGGRLYGRVSVEIRGSEPTPLADIPIIVEDITHQQRRIKTDRQGNYELNGLKPGEYIIKPILPKNYVARDEYQESRKVQIADRGCSRAFFWVNIDGGVRGSVNDSSGRSASADLRLMSVSIKPVLLLEEKTN